GNLGTGERVRQDGIIGFDLDSQGLMLGIDRQVGNGVLGVSANFANFNSKLNDAAGKVDTNAYALSLYGSRMWGGFSTRPDGLRTRPTYDGLHVDGSLTLGHNSYDSEHVVDIPGLALSRAQSKNNAIAYGMAGGLGVDAHSGRTDFDFGLSANWS